MYARGRWVDRRKWSCRQMADPEMLKDYMGGCPNYGPFLRTLNITCRIIIGIQKGTTNLTTTHIPDACLGPEFRV